jgi:hypothetical protein
MNKEYSIYRKEDFSIVIIESFNIETNEPVLVTRFVTPSLAFRCLTSFTKDLTDYVIKEIIEA